MLSLQYNPTPVTYDLWIKTSSYGVLEEATYGYEGHGLNEVRPTPACIIPGQVLVW